MRIDTSYIGMESARSYTSTGTRKLSFFVSTGRKPFSESGEEESLKNNKEEVKENIEDAKGRLTQGKNTTGIRRVHLAEEQRAIESIRQQCIVYLWSLFFGVGRANDLAERLGMKPMVTDNNTQAGVMQDSGYTATGGTVNFAATMEARPANYMTVTASEEYYFEEMETTSFSSAGVVRTADGREISFRMEVGMSRSFQQYTKKTVSQVSAMCDPLVINLNGNVANVSDQKFYFDLDADGEEEVISRLCEDSGYLALDKNGDGIINDGSELFGTKSGDGFADLAEYDEDGNGWIDENDAIWSKLQIWIQKENGESELYRLADAGVGAICLQKASTDFSQRDGEGNVSAAIRSTGIFLYENGNVGTIQHLDLAAAKLEQQA